MTLEKWSVRRSGILFGSDLLAKKRSPEQILVHQMFGSLDMVRFKTLPVDTDGVESFAKKVAVKSIAGLSNGLIPLFKSNSQILSVEFNLGDYRTVRLRNHSLAVAFVLNKDQESCTSYVELQEPSTLNGTWPRYGPVALPLSDPIILISELVRDVSL